MHGLYPVVKRCFDFTFSLLASIVLLPLLLVLCAAVMVKDPGNPFYIQHRKGMNGKRLAVLKLRSMRKDSDKVEKTLTEEQLEEYRLEFKLEDDPRLIGWKKSGDGSRCFGGWLRRTSLDELPQFYWNILLRGDMSVVGPRPILSEELKAHYTHEEQVLLLSVKPGLTGYWQAYARNNATYRTGERQHMELYYVKNCGLWMDTKILFATFGAVIKKIGAM